MSEPKPFLVYSEKANFTVTYRCSTAQLALRTLRALEGRHYDSISVTAPDGTSITEADLEESIADAAASAGGAPVALDEVPKNPAMAA